MSIYKLHYLFKERFNKLNSNHYRGYTPMEIDQLLNDATMQFLEKYSFDESHQQKFDMVSNLVVVYPEQEELVPTLVDDNIYELKLSDLTFPYLHLKRIWAQTNCGIIKVELVGQGRLNDVLNDQFQKPSKRWRRLVAALVKTSDSNATSLYIYSETNFTITGIRVEYLRKPAPVFFGGYNTPEYKQCVATNGFNCSEYYNTTSPIQDLEVNENYHSLIVDIAVKEATRILKDPSIQLQMEKINSITN